MDLRERDLKIVRKVLSSRIKSQGRETCGIKELKGDISK